MADDNKEKTVTETKEEPAKETTTTTTTEKPADSDK